MIVKVGHWIINGRNELKKMHGPIVYLFICDSAPLYIGKGTSIHRPFSPSHHAIEAREMADSVRIIFCPSQNRAIRLERYLILKYRPIYNSRYLRPTTSLTDEQTIERQMQQLKQIVRF